MMRTVLLSSVSGIATSYQSHGQLGEVARYPYFKCFESPVEELGIRSSEYCKSHQRKSCIVSRLSFNLGQRDLRKVKIARTKMKMVISVP